MVQVISIRIIFTCQYCYYPYILALTSKGVGSKLLSTDMIVSIYMAPMIKAYQFHDYISAANLLYQFNSFFVGFDYGILDLPKPKSPDLSDVMDRRNPVLYYKQYYEKYAPLMSVELGKYQREVLNYIKEERGYT